MMDGKCTLVDDDEKPLNKVDYAPVNSVSLKMLYAGSLSAEMAHILELKRRYFEDYCSDNQYAVSIKEDTAYLCLHSLKTEDQKIQYAVSRENQYAVLEIEYIRLDEEQASRNKGKVFNWETAKHAIVYNDAQTTKSDLLTKPILNPQHIDEFDLNDETSLSEYDEEEQNVLYFNDLFPFNIIHPNDLKLEKDNDDNKIDIIQSLGDMAPLPPRDQRHLWLHYQVEGYTEEIVHDFEQSLETIFGRQVNRLHILDFEGLTSNMRHDLAERMRMVYTGDDRQEVFVSHAWMRLFGIRAPLVQEFILEFFSTFRIEDEMGLDVAGSLCFQLGGARRSMTWRQFILALGLHTAREMAEDGFGAYCIYGRGQAPEKVTTTDLFYLRSMDRRAANILYLLAQYLFRHAVGRKSDARLSRGYFIGCLAHHFGLVSNDGLRGLSVMASLGPERQQVAAAGAPGVAEDAPAVDEGDQDVWALVQAPQQPPPPPPAAEIDDRSGEILHMDDFMYDTADGG
ncbi:hypothetical protein Tco_0092044 [Tanacetum coccineum]